MRRLPEARDGATLVFQATQAVPLPMLAKLRPITVQAHTHTDYLVLQHHVPSGMQLTEEDNLQALMRQHGPFRHVLCFTDPLMARGNAYALGQIVAAAHELPVDGTLWLVGTKRHGIDTLAQALGEVFTLLQVVSGSGCRVLHIEPRPITSDLETFPEVPETVEVAAQGQTLTLHVAPGVFSSHKVDEATQLLLDTMLVRTNDQILDVGCGAGAIGLVAALLAPQGQVKLVDTLPAAVRVTRLNIQYNGVANATAELSDGYSSLGIHQRFSLIVTNPPFHVDGQATTAVAERWISEAPRHLRPGGRLYVVANVFLRYPQVAARYFSSVEDVARTPRYRVMLCQGLKGTNSQTR